MDWGRPELKAFIIGRVAENASRSRICIPHGILTFVLLLFALPDLAQAQPAGSGSEKLPPTIVSRVLKPPDTNVTLCPRQIVSFGIAVITGMNGGFTATVTIVENTEPQYRFGLPPGKK
jgi:hypothetical protein